ncbi:MAG TPA: DUF885 domain-containing protein [Thermoanaerobaculia bacterium]|nr:DUF885 domain-containing protein [Thermoanaerobaculia bacterium]
MRTLALLALLLLPFFAAAALPPDLVELARQIERFPSTKGSGTESARLKRFFDLYWDASMRQSPDYATYIGYPGVDDRLPDRSAEAERFAERLQRQEIAALASIDRARLTPGEQLSYDLLQRQFDMAVEAERFQGGYVLVTSMSNNITALLELIGYMPARTQKDYENMLARLRAFPPIVDLGIAKLEEGRKRGLTPPRVTLQRVADQVMSTGDAALEPFQKMPETIPAAERERLQRTATELVQKEIKPSLEKLRDYLAKTYVPNARESIAVSDLPDGKALYAYRLRMFTTTSLTPDEIYDLGVSEVKRIRGEIDAVIASTGFKGTYQEFCDYLRTDPRFFYEKPEDILTGYRDIAKRVDPELINLFGRLPRLPYGIKAMESETNPSALYSNGTLAGGRAGFMLVNTFDLKARPKWAMESLFLHEGVPGHHLQYSLVEELGELPEWRKWDVYPVFGEGWGLYAESLGGELGLYKDPYSKFGALNNEIWRAMRLVLDVGLHVKGWTREQAVAYCRANSAKTEREIENEVNRYIVSPGAVPAYKIGELKIKELRRYAEKTLGAKFDIRAFHDQILGVGQLPLDILEARIKAWVATQRTDAH